MFLNEISLVMNINKSAYAGPIKQPLCIRCIHIDTTVAHWSSKIVVPVRPMKAIPLIEIHDVRNIRQIISGSGHVVKNVFHIYVILAAYGWMGGCTGGNQEGIDNVITLVGIHHLIAQIHIDPASVTINFLRQSRKSVRGRFRLSRERHWRATG